MSSNVSAIADLVAALAIVSSLCLVAYELHQTRVQSELSNWREVLQALTDYKAVTNDLGFAEFLVKAHDDYDVLSDAEKLSFGLYLEQGVHIYGNFLKHNESLPRKLEGLEGAVMNMLGEMLTTPGGVHWWQEAHQRGRFMPSTYTTIDALLTRRVQAATDT